MTIYRNAPVDRVIVNISYAHSQKTTSTNNIRWPLTGQKGRSTHKTISRPYNSVNRCIPINSHFHEILITDHSILVLAVVWSTDVGTVQGAWVRWQNPLNFWLLRWWSCNALGSGSDGLWFESRRWHVGILRPYLTFRVVYDMCVYELT